MQLKIEMSFLYKLVWKYKYDTEPPRPWAVHELYNADNESIL